MKNYLSIVLVLICAFPCFGQRSLTTADLSSRVAALKQPNNYSVRYDQAKNLTSVLFGAKEPIKGARMYLYAGSLISVSIGFDFAGQTLDREPDKFSLIFYFLDASPLVADKVRDLRLSDQKATLDITGGITGEMGGTGLLGRKKKIQTLTFAMRREDLQTVSAMPELQISLGGDKFQLNHGQRQIFKDIAAVGSF